MLERRVECNTYLTCMYRPGVAKLLDSPSHFLKFEIFREPQLNTCLKGLQKKKDIKKFTEIIFTENI